MQPSVIIIPQPAHHDPSGSDIPTSYVIAYVAIALLVWAATAFLVARHDRNSGPIEAVLIGSIAAIGWPITLIALPIWALANAATAHRKAP
jgi:steroid 5-alpha reductase family enzyme